MAAYVPMFSEEEIEALVLGSRWVARRADKKLQLAAANVLAKISAVLPDNLRHQMEFSGLFIGPTKSNIEHDSEKEALIRLAIRKELKVEITYRDVKNEDSQRMIWPIALGFFEDTQVIVAWCELREDFRHFRTDRVMNLRVHETRYHQRRQALLKTWRQINNISEY